MVLVLGISRQECRSHMILRLPMLSTADYTHMAQALRLAERGLYTTDPNPRVGCVIVRDDEVVGEGWHERAGEPHAEVHALRQAGERARASTAYVTLEPCSHHGRTPPCADALLNAGVARVVAAMVDPNPKVAGQGLARLEQAGIETAVGLLEAEARQLNPGFISRFTRGRPYVRCKLAMSLDGRTALANGESKWITGEAAREDVQRLRARSSVIVTGINTVLADDPRMNARVPFECKQPDRVVLDSTLRIPLDAQILQQQGQSWIATTTPDAASLEALEQAGVGVIELLSTDGKLDLHALMGQLNDLQYNEVLIEAGPTLSGAFLSAGLIDELVIYMAPHLLGDSARGLFHLPLLEKMEQRVALELKDLRQVGSDIRLILKPQRT
jgi:diaminohydroxyphosphoribosylaminopyrimidine deaminase/5-amino-6-(5-phosphoribosylamino)uracil reductase